MEELKVAVAEFKEGLPIPKPGPGGYCTVGSHASVRFGISETSTCALPLTRAQLKDMCMSSNTAAGTPLEAFVPAMAAAAPSAGERAQNTCPAAVPSPPATSPPLSMQLLDGLFWSGGYGAYGGNVSYVGGCGNADPRNVAEWVQVQAAPVQGTMSWSDETSTCSGVVTGARSPSLMAH